MCAHVHVACASLRAYLKSVAKKLAEDVDNLKNTAGTMGKVSSCETHTLLLPYMCVHAPGV